MAGWRRTGESGYTLCYLVELSHPTGSCFVVTILAIVFAAYLPNTVNYRPS